MNGRTNLLVTMGAAMLGLLAVFNVAIGVYHTVLFTLHGSQSMFSAAYGIAVSPADMRDPARQLGSDAIEVYSILLGGCGVLSLWATVTGLRRRLSELWLSVALLGIVQLAVLYGLIVPGRLTGANAYAGVVLYVAGLVLVGLGVIHRRRQLTGAS